MRRPTLALSIILVLIALAAALTMRVTAQLPSFGMAVQADAGGRLTLGDASTRLLAISGGRDRVDALSASDLLGNDRVPPSNAELARQERMRRIASEGRATLSLQQASAVAATAEILVRPRGLSALPAAFWVFLFVGTVAAAVGAWVLVLRPRAWEARTVAASGLGILLAAYPTAIIAGCELIFGGRLYAATVWVNWIGVQIFATAATGLLARHPAPLLGPRATAALMALPTLALVAAFAAPDFAAGQARLMLSMALSFALLVGLSIAQWRATCDDPAGRAFLRFAGIVTLLCFTLYVVLFMVPQMRGQPPIITTAASFLLLLPFYGAIAVGIGRLRLFDLDRWSYAVILYGVAAAALVLVDVLLAFAFRLAPQNSWLIAAAAVTAAWILLRQRIVRWIMPHDPVDQAALFRTALQVAMLHSDEERQARWLAALQQLFAPLQIEPQLAPVDQPRIEGGGLALLVPAVAGSPPLALRYPRSGRGLFGAKDVSVARDFASLCATVDADRSAYDEGLRRERDRIARDLHDDVSGRLLTSLHRSDAAQIRSDVRAALADVRYILSGLTGQHVATCSLIATMRHECGERLAAAGIALDWPLLPADAPDPLLDYKISKNVGSVVREAVSNIVSHSRAGRVCVTIAIEDGDLDMAIADDGVGVAAEACDEGHGLRNMKRRMEELGGSLAIEQGERGTCVRLRAPLP